MQIGMYSGMKPNEICSLQVCNIRKIENVLCFESAGGKTKSAARIIPVNSHITHLVETLIQKPQDGFFFYHYSILLTVQTVSVLLSTLNISQKPSGRLWEKKHLAESTPSPTL